MKIKEKDVAKYISANKFLIAKFTITQIIIANKFETKF